MSYALEYYDPANDSRAATQAELWGLFEKGRAWVSENVMAGNGLAYTGVSAGQPSKYIGLAMPESDTLGDLLVVSDGPPTEEVRLSALGEDLIPALPEARTVLGLRTMLVARHRSTYLLCDEKGTLVEGRGPMTPDFYLHAVLPLAAGVKNRVYLVEPEPDDGPERARGLRYDLLTMPVAGRPVNTEDYVRQENGMPPPIMLTEYQVLMDAIDMLRDLRRPANPQG
jgi:hypothetical protein